MASEVKQVGGDHYSKVEGEQHWRRVARLGLTYHQGNATAYIERCSLKGNMREDLEKAISYCREMINLLDDGLFVPQNPDDPDYPQPYQEEPAPVAVTRRSRK